MDLDLTPSPRSHGAQRMITATVLVCEALVVFFAVLVAHQLMGQDRSNWRFRPKRQLKFCFVI